MDMILISGEKLKVTLTESDMEEMHIDVESLDYGCVETKKVFWSLLDKAKSLTGFDADRRKLYVQVFPDREGGCEMYITKMPDLSVNVECGNENGNALKEERRRKDAGKRSARSVNVGVRLAFEPLLLLCKRLKESGMRLSASLYVEESDSGEKDVSDGEKYVLVLHRALPSYTAKAVSESSKFSVPPCLSEYGEVKRMSREELTYLSEHGEKLIDSSAVEILSGLT